MENRSLLMFGCALTLTVGALSVYGACRLFGLPVGVGQATALVAVFIPFVLTGFRLLFRTPFPDTLTTFMASGTAAAATALAMFDSGSGGLWMLIALLLGFVTMLAGLFKDIDDYVPFRSLLVILGGEVLLIFLILA